MTREDSSTDGNRGRQHSIDRRMVLVLAYALLIRLVFVFLTPAWQAPDEYPHFWYASELSRTSRFPAVSPDYPAYEAFQPPLYYVLAAVILRALPEAPPGSSNAVEAPGLTLIVLRLLSVGFGVLATWLTYASARQLAGAGRNTPVVAAMFVATLPTFVGVTSWVNNDGLVTLLSSVCLLVLLRPNVTAAGIAWAGCTAGLALLAKTSAAILLPLIVIAVAVKEPHWKTLAKLILVAVACWLPGVVLMAAKNIALTGSPLVLNTQVQPQWNISLESLVWSLRNLGWSFWLAFGRTYRIALPPFVYLLTVVPLGAAAAYGIWKVRAVLRSDLIVVLAGIGLALVASLYYSLSYPPMTMTSWGKNLFPVLTLFALFFAFGWEHALRRTPAIAYIGLTLMVAGCGWAACRTALL